MGWKYEIAIWVNNGHQWHYRTIYTSNNTTRALIHLWKNRTNGCVKIEIRR